LIQLEKQRGRSFEKEAGFEDILASMTTNILAEG
jgi:hypothetical protein